MYYGDPHLALFNLLALRDAFFEAEEFIHKLSSFIVLYFAIY